MQRAARCLVHNREQISADAIRLRLDDAEHRVGRDHGVHGSAATLQHLHAGPRGERLARGDDAVFRSHARPADDNAHGLNLTTET